MEKLTDKQIKLVLTQLTFKMLMEKQTIYSYKNRDTLTKEDIIFLNSFLDKDNLIDILSDEPQLCSILLRSKSDFFDARQKIKLIQTIAKDRDLLIEFINDILAEENIDIRSNYFRKTLGVQSEIVSLIGEDAELIVIFARSLINNYKVKDVKEYINKLKINKKQKEFVNSALVAAKLIN